MKIVGVGCGPGLLTEEAEKAIASATLIMGSRRALELAASCLPAACEVQVVSDFSSFKPPGHAVVLSTGDPMLAGLGYLGGEIIPGISSLQVAASRLRIPLEKISVIVAHGRNHDRATGEARAAIDQGRFAFIIADPGFNLEALATVLSGSGEDVEIAVCEDLGYPAERISFGPIRNPPRPRSSLFCVFAGRFENRER
jgi:cobalt-precorrin-7 (C5)-methyltransferase